MKLSTKTNSSNKRGLEYSPFGEKSKEAANRRFTKRKSSKSLLNVFMRESLSMQSEESASERRDSSSFEKTANGIPNSEDIHQPQSSKRMKSMMANNNDDENVKLDENNIYGISPPVDWDDSAARSAFDGPFVSKQNMSDIYPIDFSQLNQTDKKIPINAKLTSNKLPCDMRLATKLRLISEKPFPWIVGIGKQNEQGNYPVKNAISPNKFDKAMSNLAVDINLLEKDIESGDPLIILQSAAIYHQFPSIGSIQLFPRRNIGSKSALKSANLLSIESNFIDDLAIHWQESFDFLFHRWICGSRKSFYLCSPQFTIIFVNMWKTNSPKKPASKLAKTPQKNIVALLSPNKNAKSPHRNCSLTTKSPKSGQHLNLQQFIVITPTTAGFRQILQENGVRFSAPFKTTTEFVNLMKEECAKDFLPLEEDATAELDHDEWLKGIGISPKTTLGMKRSASQLDGPSPPTSSFIEGGESSSSRIPADISAARSSNKGTPPNNDSSSSFRSTILIKGQRDTEALFKLLVAQPNLINTKTGPQIGLPATLISHSPFRHSTQKELSMNSQLIRKLGQSPKYILTMENGPILPTALKLIVDFGHKLCGQSNMQIQLNGRQQFNGINEALDGGGGGIVNFNELNWDGKKFEYF